MTATVLLQNTPAGTAGTAITQANRATTTNTPDAFDNIVFGTGGSASIATNGSKTVHRLASTGGNATEGWGASLGGSKSDFSVKAKFIAPAAPPSNFCTILKAYTDVAYTTAAWSIVINPDGKAELYTGTGLAFTLAPVLSPGTEYTVRAEIISGTSGELHLYNASDVEVAANIKASPNFGATQSIRRGLGNGNVLAQLDMTEIKVGIGPGLIDAATPIVVTAGADQSIYSTDTATVAASVSNGSGGPVTYAWTKSGSSPAGSFTASTSATTDFVPSGGSGTYTLTVTATDSSGSSSDTVVITVTAPAAFAVPAAVSAAGWTPTGGSALAVVSDGSDATYARSSDNPTGLVFDVTHMGSLAQPAAGQDYVHQVRIRKNGASSGTVVGKLYTASGSTLKSTTSAVTIPDSAAYVDLVFPAADIASIASADWTSGVRVTATVTAAA